MNPSASPHADRSNKHIRKKNTDSEEKADRTQLETAKTKQHHPREKNQAEEAKDIEYPKRDREGI